MQRVATTRTAFGAGLRSLAVLVLALFGCGEPADANGAGGKGTASGGSAATSGGSGGNGQGGTGTGGSNTGGTGGSNGPPGTPGVAIGNTCYPLCGMGVTGSAEDPDWGFENMTSCVIPGSPTAVVALTCTTGEPVPTDMAPHPGVVLNMTCYPLCEVATTGTADAPDWGYEKGRSCVLPGTKTAVAQPCTTGMPLPDPNELCRRPGVVTLDSGDTNERQCSALCTYVTDPAADLEGDDWDFEYSSSCVIPGSPTSKNQVCTTCDPVPPAPMRPGVVVTQGGGMPECVPLCTVNTDPALDPDRDDWAWEDNSSCVIPGSAPAATNQACTTGMALPDPMPRPGVEVKDGVDGELTCVATCTFYLTATQQGANNDGFADDWAWENSSPCIIPGTLTGKNTACTTLTTPLPAPEPRPGIMVNGDPVMDSCKWADCVPLCRNVTMASDPAYPDWAWEDNNPCVIPGTTTATVIPKAVENHGYMVPPRKCTWGAPKVDFLKPPALDAAKIVQAHFQTSGKELRDPYGKPFVARGVNNSHAWYDICGQYSAYEALDNIAAQGANTVRVGWAFQSIDPGGPMAMTDPEKQVIGTNPALLAEILYRVVELKMVPILAINDPTGQTKAGEALRMAKLMVDNAEYKAVLDAYEPYLLLGIANEYNIPAASFNSEYTAAVTYLRNAGVDSTLVITGNDWGQGCDSLLGSGPITTADPLHNVLYDVHIYTYLTYMGQHGGTAAMVQGCMDSAASANIPLLVGEFGNTHSSGPVEWQTVVSRAAANAQGMTPWLWYGDTEYPALNMNTTWEGPYTSWGTSVGTFNGTKATIFP